MEHFLKTYTGNASEREVKKALSLNAFVVVDSCGAGASPLAKALLQEGATERLAEVFKEDYHRSYLPGLRIARGFPWDDYDVRLIPAHIVADVLPLVGEEVTHVGKFLRTSDIWRAAFAVAVDRLLGGKLGYSGKTWEDAIPLCREETEKYARDMERANKEAPMLVTIDLLPLVNSNALTEMEVKDLLRGALQFALWTMGFSNLRCKVFITPQMADESTIAWAFPDASKLTHFMPRI